MRPASRARGFAMLAGLDACVRGMLISVMPLVVYRALGDAALVSQLDVDAEEEKLSWLGKMDASSLKMKIAASIVAISSISGAMLC